MDALERIGSLACLAVALLALALLAGGARDVSAELRRRPAENLWTAACVDDWAQTMAAETPETDRDEWHALAAEHPSVLLLAGPADPGETPTRHVR